LNRDPDLGPHFLITKLRIRIMLLSSVALKMTTENRFFFI